MIPEIVYSNRSSVNMEFFKGNFPVGCRIKMWLLCLHFYVAFTFTGVGNGLFESGILNFMWRQEILSQIMCGILFISKQL